jgi:hypothetical protein
MDWTLQLFFRREYVQLGVHRVERAAEAPRPGLDGEAVARAGAP